MAISNSKSGFLALLLGACMAPGGWGDSSLLTKASDRHKESLALLSHFQCQFKSTSVDAHGREILAMEGEYYRQPHQFCLVEKFSNTTSRTWFKGGNCQILITDKLPNGKMRHRAQILPESGTKFDSFRAKALFVFANPHSKLVPLGELLTTGTRLQSVELAGPHAQQEVCIKLLNKDNLQEICLDPATNYMVRKFSSARASQAGSSHELEVLKFHEPAPGIFFPAHIEIREKKTPSLPPTHRGSIYFSKVSVNQHVNEATFKPTFPIGTEVANSMDGKEYRVNLAGVMEPTGKTLTLLPPLSHSNELARGQTKSEPEPFGQWILPVSCGFVVLGLTILLSNGIKRKAAAP